MNWPKPEDGVPIEGLHRTVLLSSLWAAAADALGWTTELSYGVKGVVRRTGEERVTCPVPWKRVIGGRGGPQILLPAGTYSDDTQLRLGVSRAIRGDGSFDVEAFAKIEMTVWPTYALGAGLGSKAAAASLTRRDVNWFSNFFERGRNNYVLSGGNGAAMRIQPHVWAFSGNIDELVVDVFRNAIVSHGHPHGFCGAIFHALCLEDTIRNHAIPAPDTWFVFLDRCLDIPRLLENDPQLSTFWLSEWETKSGISLRNSILKFREKGIRDIELSQEVEGESPAERYRDLLCKLGCLKPELRGSGWKTALAAVSLSYIYREGNIKDALITTANELESDTDTIGTMAGALLGVISERVPEWPVQDCSYLGSEAKRLSSIAMGESQSSFLYPDLGHWNPPKKQYESMGTFEARPVISGFGEYNAYGEEYKTKANKLIWQWCELPFGQNILAKRKLGTGTSIMPGQLPRKLPDVSLTSDGISSSGMTKPATKRKLTEDGHVNPHSRVAASHEEDNIPINTGSVDTWTNDVISSNFDDKVLGRTLNQCIETSLSVESAIGFASIIAKAKLARMRRRR